MSRNKPNVPDSTAVRVALWRALHVELDSAPHILADDLGLKMAHPESHWRERPDMHPMGTRGYRAAIVARARLIEDLVLGQSRPGQYVILGAGLDSFAQRHPEIANRLQVFEIDQPATQTWKRQRLMELGFGIPAHLHLVPVDFEAGESWIEKLAESGFDAKKPAILSSTGVAMYLTKEANFKTLQQITQLAKGSILALTFMLPPEKIKDAGERAQYQMVCERAKASGTPFLSFFEPAEILELARKAGFAKVEHIGRNAIIEKYFAGRADKLVPAEGEEFLLATV